MKSLKFLIMSLVFILFLVACGSESETSSEDASNGDQSSTGSTSEQITLIAAHVTPTDGSYQYGMEKFKEVLEAETNGEVTVSIHPNGELGGNEDELVQNMSTGGVDIIVAAPGFMAQSVREVDIVSLPYLFRDVDHWQERLDGEVGAELTELVENGTDFKVLGYWMSGIRQYFGSKPIHSPDDLRGVRIRVMNSPAIQNIWSTLGAQPANVAFNELYQGLQNNVVDAAENDFANIIQMRFQEVAPYISLTNHDIATRFFIMSGDKFDGLSAEHQAAVEKAAEEATRVQRETDLELNRAALEELEEAGANINEVDLTPFIEMTQPVREQVASDLGLESLLEKINE